MSVTMTAGARRSTAVFVRHFLEMTAAMVAGMVVYGAVVGLVAAAFGGSLEGARVGQPELFALGMAAAMSVPMVAWMRRRGHGRRACAEMTAAMFVPAVIAIALHWAGVLDAASVCPLACAAMFPAMLAAMAFRLDEYA